MLELKNLTWGNFINKGGGCILLFIAIGVIYAIFQFCVIFTPQEFSTKISDWGAFASCVSTILSFVSVMFVYNAYIKQMESSIKQAELSQTQSKIMYQTSFNQQFVHYLKTLKEIYDIDARTGFKEMKNNIYNNLIYIIDNDLENKIGDIQYLREIQQESDRFFKNHPDSDIKHYFKYLYHIIKLVDTAEYINKETYMSMLQSQMSKTELFCYLFNILDTAAQKESDITKIADRELFKLLDKYHFFEDLFIDRRLHEKITKRIFPKTNFFKIPNQ